MPFGKMLGMLLVLLSIFSRSAAKCGIDDCHEKPLYLCNLHECTANKSIILRYKKITGTIPSNLISLNRTLTSLQIYNNFLSGTVPSFLGSLISLEGQLVLTGNDLTGTLPPSLGSLTKLTSRMSFSDNHLTGLIPKSIGSMTSLQRILLADNGFFGKVPSSMCNLLTNLNYSDDQACDLSGDVPMCLRCPLPEACALNLTGPCGALCYNNSCGAKVPSPSPIPDTTSSSSTTTNSPALPGWEIGVIVGASLAVVGAIIILITCTHNNKKIGNPNDVHSTTLTDPLVSDEARVERSDSNN
jgi:hypothetical protein